MSAHRINMFCQQQDCEKKKKRIVDHTWALMNVYETHNWEQQFSIPCRGL